MNEQLNRKQKAGQNIDNEAPWWYDQSTYDERKAEATDIDDRLKETFFSFNGRLNRLAYSLRVIGLFFLGFIFLAFLTYVGMAYSGELLLPVVRALMLPITIIMLVVSISLIIRRLHDINLSGLYYFGILIFGAICGVVTRAEPQAPPAVILNSIMLIVLLLLIFWPGTKGPNKYGPDPLSGNDAGFDLNS